METLSPIIDLCNDPVIDPPLPVLERLPFVHVTHASQMVAVKLGVGPAFIDLETYGHPGWTALDILTCHPRLLILAAYESPVYVIDLNHVPFAAVADHLEGRVLIGHNLGYDLPILTRHGLPHPMQVRCTMLASQVLMAGIDVYGGKPVSHSLGACMERFCHKTVAKELGGSDWSVPVLTPDQLQYAANDVHYVRELYTHLMGRVDKYGLAKTYQLECDFLPAVIGMSVTGIRVDKEQWVERSKAAEVEAARLEKILLDQLPLPPARELREVGLTKKGDPKVLDVRYNEKAVEYNKTRQWNLNSSQQLMDVLGQVGVKLFDTKYETLIEMKGEHPILDSLIDYRVMEKEATAFGQDWLKHLRPGTDRVYPSWWQMGTRSGRMSNSNPNLQQTPRGGCRKGIIAGEGRLLVRADYSQIEARIAALVAPDRLMTELFINSKVDKTFDIHRFTASRVLDKDAKDVTKEERQIGKSLLFGLLFGMQAKSLRVYCRTNYGVSMTDAQAVVFRNKFFSVFTDLEAWHNRSRKIAYKKNDFRTLIGRRRYVPDGEEVNRLGLELNHKVQGTGADLLKMAGAEIWRRRDEMPQARLNALIHDEIILDVEEDYAKAAGEWLREIMIGVGDKLLDPIPTDTEIKIGKSWGG